MPVGLLNCYEAEFPELSRLLALRGAKLLVIPTAADAWAQLSNGERTDRPYPDVSRTLIPAHASKTIVLWPMPTVVVRNQSRAA